MDAMNGCLAEKSYREQANGKSYQCIDGLTDDSTKRWKLYGVPRGGLLESWHWTVYDGPPPDDPPPPPPPPPPCQEQWSHEGGGSECGYCRDGYVYVGKSYPYDCMLISEPGDCVEGGKYYEEKNGQGFCVDECRSASFVGNMCLNPKDDGDECRPGSPGYQGYFGTGPNAKHVCKQSCPPGSTFGAVGYGNTIVEGCVPTNSNPPTCPPMSIPVVDEDGIYCRVLNMPHPDDPAPNTDMDGDGNPDIYMPGNDPNFGTRALGEILKQIGVSNAHLGNISNKLDNLPKGGGGGSNPGNGDNKLDVSGLVQDMNITSDQVKSDMNSVGDQSLSAVDELVDSFSDDGPFNATDLSAFTSGITGLIPSVGCSDLKLGVGGHMMTLSCADIEGIRSMLGFVVYAFTLFRLFEIVTRKTGAQ